MISPILLWRWDITFVIDEQQQQTNKNLYSEKQDEEEARIPNWHMKLSKYRNLLFQEANASILFLLVGKVAWWKVLNYMKRCTYSEHFESNEKCQMENGTETLHLLKKFLLMKPEINSYEFDLPNFCWVEWTRLVEVILAAFPQHASRVFSIPPATHVAYIYYLRYIHRKLLIDEITPSSERSFPNRALHCMC